MANLIPPSQTTPSTPSTGAPSPNLTPEQLFTASSTRGLPAKSKPVGLVAAVEAISKNKNINDTNNMLGELSLQHEIVQESGDKARQDLINKWFRKSLGATSLAPFVGMKNGFLRIIHTVGQYQAGFGEECEYDECMVGFLGDRTASSMPMALKLNPKRFGWGKAKDTFTSEATLRTFYSDPGNRNKFYVLGEGDTKEDLFLPLLLQVPLAHVEWLLQTPRTPFEYHEKLLADLGGDQVDARPAQLSVPLMWLRRACMAAASSQDGSTKKSIKEMVLEPVLADGLQPFQQWLEGRLDTVLGPATAENDNNVVVQHVTHQYNQPPPGSSPYGESHQSFNGGASGTNEPSTMNKNEKGVLSTLQLAALRGWARAVYVHELPAIWSQLQSTNDVDDARTYINAAWEKSRIELGLDIGECNSFYLEDQTIKDWKKCKFAPGGSVPVWEYFMKGMSILLCTNFSAEAQLKSQDREKAWNETPYTRTTEEAQRRERREPRQPPMSWSPLKYLINTYVIFVHAFFTSECPHFKSVWACREVLVTMRERKEHFNRHTCALIVYHIIKDSRQFFSEQLLPRDFDGPVVGQPRARAEIMWPDTHLYDLAKHIFKLQLAALELADLPEKWKVKEATTPPSNTNDGKRPAQDSGGRSQGGPAKWRDGNSGAGYQGGGYGFSFGSGNGGGNFGSGGSGDFREQVSRHSEMPPQIREHLGKAIDECLRLCPTFGPLQLKQFGDLDMWDLPILNTYADERGGYSCNQGLLGICRFTDSTCKFKRVDPRDLPPDFVKAFVDKAGPALEKCITALRQGKKATPSTYGGGYQSYHGGGRGGYNGSRKGPARF